MKLLMRVALAFTLLCGFGMLTYPALSDLVARSKQSEVIHNYTTVIECTDQDELDARRREAEEYNDALAAFHQRNEPAWALKSRLDAYEHSLSDSGIIGYLDMESINVHIPVYHGTSDQVLSKGVGHLPDTPLPTGRLGEHTALAGHTGLVNADLFNELHSAKLGDTFILYILEEKLVYEVDNIATVLPEDTALLAPDPNHNYVTLITCTPKVVNTHRLLVRGNLMAREKVAAADPNDSWQAVGGSLDIAPAVAGACGFLAANGPAALVLLMLILVLRDSYKRRRQMRRQACTLFAQLRKGAGRPRERLCS
jgi:sortase A